jgi:hypothetical protein
MKIGVFNGQLSQKYKSLEQILCLLDKFEQKSGIPKKSKVTDDLSNPKRAYKSDGFFLMYLLP